MTVPRTILWKPAVHDHEEPLYQAIVRELATDIAGGRLHPGDRLPTHRQLARALDVGLGTVTRAYKEAEKSGLVSSRVGSGTFVATASAGNPLGLPSTGLVEMSVDLPLHSEDPDLASALAKVARRGGAQRLLCYQDHAGSGRHRRAGAAWVERFDLAAGADGIVVCAGTHHALCVALLSICTPGDIILCDELSYPGLRAIASHLQLRLHGIPEEGPGQGIDVAAIEAACKRQRVRALYTVPSFHNPTTAQLDAGKRGEIARLAKKYDFFVLEDDVHRLSSHAPPPPIASMARDHSFYVASFSKAVVPGLRVAFLVPPPKLVRRAAEAIWATLWTVSALPVEVAATWIEDGTADAVVSRKRREAGERQKLCARLLDGARFDAQRNGYYAWLHLPSPWTSLEFALEAREAGVAVTPSTPFLVGPIPAPAAVRVCLAAPSTRPEVEQGLEILHRLLATGPARNHGSASPRP
ncbi:MAG: PLP-dependent aminotransferase family protein [Planctomycetota bacterium]|nr:MAG: PLP-dependent aminotransferase family protein [Planctomycetota bacterium]